MANALYRDAVSARVKAAKDVSNIAAKLEHNGLAGAVREALVRDVLQPLLPTFAAVGTGKITDQNGGLSHQIDLIIHAPDRVPPLLYASAQVGAFPAEAVFYALEVKSTLNASELSKIIDNARSILALRVEAPLGAFNIRRTAFAWTTDLAPSGKTELARYFEADASAFSAPVLNAFCVAGREYCYFTDGYWVRCTSTPNFDEVISFFAGVVNTAQEIRRAQAGGAPMVPLGRYLIADATYERHYYLPRISGGAPFQLINPRVDFDALVKRVAAGGGQVTDDDASVAKALGEEVYHFVQGVAGAARQ